MDVFIHIEFCSFISTSFTSVHEWNFPKFELETSLWLKQEDEEASSHSGKANESKTGKNMFSTIIQ